MRVRSKLADVEFRFGDVERKGNDLIINSHPAQTLKSRVYVSPADVFSMLGRLLVSPQAWVFILGLPYFWWKSRRPPPQH